MHDGNPPRSLVYVAAAAIAAGTAVALLLLPGGPMPRLPPTHAAATSPAPSPAPLSASATASFTASASAVASVSHPAESRGPAAACSSSPTPYGPHSSPPALLGPACRWAGAEPTRSADGAGAPTGPRRPYRPGAPR